MQALPSMDWAAPSTVSTWAISWSSGLPMTRRSPEAIYNPRHLTRHACPALTCSDAKPTVADRSCSRTTLRSTAMDLLAERGRRVSLEELNTSRLLAHARKQAVARNLDDILIVDVDGHHYENECFDEFLPLVENEVLRHLILAGRAKGRGALTPSQVSFQDMGGRVTRYPPRASEKTEGDKLRDIELGQRWMDAMSIDYSCLFPTLLLSIGTHPSVEMEIELCWAYNRWLTETALPQAGGRMYSMLSLPLSDTDEALRQVETFGG